MTKFTIITTCKGRLNHLKQTLPQFIKQRDTKVIVVDYSCPEHSGGWVRENWPEAMVIEVPGQEYFRANKARNTGAAAAQSPFLMFLDADSLISDDFAVRVDQALEDGMFLRIRYTPGNDLNGACIVPAASYRAVQGYDEVIEGYGGEEQEFYWRLRRMGLKARYLLAEGLCQPIRHDKQSRIAYQVEKNMRKAFLQVRGYRLCKEALLGVMFTPELEVAQRKELWQTVERAIESGGDDIALTVPHPPIASGFLSDWDMSRVVQIRMRRKRGKN
jgi:glycosyltransferase involved in cell wall biosynthesis